MSIARRRCARVSRPRMERRHRAPAQPKTASSSAGGGTAVSRVRRCNTLQICELPAAFAGFRKEIAQALAGWAGVEGACSSRRIGIVTRIPVWIEITPLRACCLPTTAASPTEDHYTMTLNITRSRVSRGQRRSKHRDLFSHLSEAFHGSSRCCAKALPILIGSLPGDSSVPLIDSTSNRHTPVIGR